MKLRSANIVLIESDLETQQTIFNFLKQNNYKVYVFTDVSTAVLGIEQLKEPIDLIVADIATNPISALHRGHPKIPVIVTSNIKNPEGVFHAISMGASDFLLKPLNLAQLLISLQRAVLNSSVQFLPETSSHVVCVSPEFRRVLSVAKRVAASMANIFISGESGTGKEVVARSIHDWSRRKNAPFVAINCSALPETLLESELFGHAKGAFTGATEARVGLFEEAQGGTLFLDEIGDLNLALQAKLLRVIQDKEIRRVGENKFRKIDVRLISATLKDLNEEVKKNRFRNDLYFRLNVIPIYVSPLRRRKDDILPLAKLFLKSATESGHSKIFSNCVKNKLLNLSWPGNVRELQNAVERAVILSDGPIIYAKDFIQEEGKEIVDLSIFSNLTKGTVLTIDEMVSDYVKQVLAKNNGAKEKTSRELGIDRKTLYRKIRNLQH